MHTIKLKSFAVLVKVRICTTVTTPKKLWSPAFQSYSKKNDLWSWPKMGSNTKRGLLPCGGATSQIVAFEKWGCKTLWTQMCERLDK